MSAREEPSEEHDSPADDEHAEHARHGGFVLASGASSGGRLQIPRHAGGVLFEGDNLELFANLPASVADLIVTDPPFFTGLTRVGPPLRRRWSDEEQDAEAPDPHAPAVLDETAEGDEPAVETGDEEAAGERDAHGITRSPGQEEGNGRRRRGFLAFEDCWDSMEDYLAFLRPRLEAMHRLLKPNGSIVVHLDYRTVHEVKLEMDRVFGRDQWINEIIWHYTGGGRSKRYFSRKHDTLLWYARGDRWTFNIDSVRTPYSPTSGYARAGIVAQSGKHYWPHPNGTPFDDVWDIPIVNPLAGERTGYPTQKPEKLLERIVTALSRPGDLVLDPFCGSGTTAAAAARLGRRWIAGDISPQAIAIARRRLKRICGEGRFRESSTEKVKRTVVRRPRKDRPPEPPAAPMHRLARSHGGPARRA